MFICELTKKSEFFVVGKVLIYCTKYSQFALISAQDSNKHRNKMPYTIVIVSGEWYICFFENHDCLYTWYVQLTKPKLQHMDVL